MMKRLLSVLAAGALGLALVAGGAPMVAHAATKPAKVLVNGNTTYLVAKGKKAKVKPQIITEGKVKVKSAKITVKQGKKTVAKNKSSVNLKAGTYKVTTTVKYTKNGKKKVYTGKKTQTVKVQVFSPSKEATNLVGAINKYRAKALKNSGLSSTALTPNATLNVLAQQYAAQAAKADKGSSTALPDFTSFQSQFWGLNVAGIWTGSPYKSYVSTASSVLLQTGSPLGECGRDANQALSCAAGNNYKHVGVGFAISKSGKIYTWVLVASGTR
ncbi:MAG: hypothetical protein VB080_11245 [Propionicimonas sp.]|uniref:CAP domain-containing protein n=1 Tax=Propionicimonas sp. TaxID=1955623 RepID=UPI002B20B2B4|nr:CAP domain-containing protein [Propionicimonas sp.]MEA4944995.1 hypothetical protein [Propionicimonas sp.]MEA5052971.1 hypothetical protein [Propionicimonas sp.]MEA5118091.1 hypothetical protein [Propionicimonas sp.]